MLTGPSCPTHGLPDAIGVEGYHSHLVLGQWPETLQLRAGLTSGDAHLPKVRGHFTLHFPPAKSPTLHLPSQTSLPPAARSAVAVPALSEECTGPCSQSQGHWLQSTVPSGIDCLLQTAPGLGDQRSSHQLGRAGSQAIRQEDWGSDLKCSIGVKGQDPWGRVSISRAGSEGSTPSLVLGAHGMASALPGGGAGAEVQVSTQVWAGTHWAGSRARHQQLCTLSGKQGAAASSRY